MDRSFEVFLGRRLNAYSQEATRQRVNWLCGKAKGRVLDVGCSQGLVPWLLGHKGFKVTGIDLDDQAIAWARAHLTTAAPHVQQKIELICADFLDFAAQQAGKSFDTILAGEYLEHLPDDVLDAQLGQMATLLAPDGKLALTVPLGLHPHPDHEQVFFPRNLAEKLVKHFCISDMQVEDVYLRCVCDVSKPKQKPSEMRLLELSERGLVQIQKKSLAGKRAAKIAQLRDHVRPEANIWPYLNQKKPVRTKNVLEQALSAQGLEAPFLYDRYLFASLNKIYRSKPLVPQPRQLTPQGLFAQADKRVDYLQKHFGAMQDMRCLEIGCGRGESAVRLAQRLHCVVTGVDTQAYPEWPEHQGEHVRLLEVDLTEKRVFAPASFDYIFSFAVLEHVQRPLSMLEVMFDLLKPGGQIYVTANLYRGPMASHCYREVFFPWPHLLFETSVFERFYRDLDRRQGVAAPAWVNKLTHLHYLEKVRQLGFEIVQCTYSTLPFDEDFYECFAEKLGCYPREDLEKDFINLRLRKPGTGQ